VCPGSNDLLDGLVANWLAIELALKDQSNILLLGHDIDALIAASLCDMGIPAGAP
jgi:hypothetical protein